MRKYVKVLVRVRDGIREKQCTECLGWLPFKCFGLLRKGPFGRRYECRPCRKDMRATLKYSHA